MSSGETGTTQLFDKSQEYDALLKQGLKLTGEDKEYFAEQRIRDLKETLAGFRPRRILDFGCGIGDTAQRLAAVFEDSEVVGIDTAGPAIRHACNKYANERISFYELSRFEPRGDFDLCYCSGVFHHIPSAERSQALQLIRAALAPHGRLALFENNPWNPGTRMVMSRIPFDSDAEPLSPQVTLAMLRENSWQMLGGPRFLFFFPRWLAALRPFEQRLVHFPLGGQYYVQAVKQP